jgi:hypothetical protein
MAVPCKATAKSTGNRCKRNAIDGGTVCNRHGGAAPQVKARAAVRVELSRWQVGDATADPGETLLALLTQSRMRAELYAGLLEDAYEAAEKLSRLTWAESELVVPEGETSRADEDGEEPTAVQQARAELERVFSMGGLSALIGHTYSASQSGSIYATGEAIRGLAKLESDERDRCANFARLALAAGIAERTVRLAEAQAQMLSSLLKAALQDAGLGERANEVLGNVGRRLRLLSS